MMNAPIRSLLIILVTLAIAGCDDNEKKVTNTNPADTTNTSRPIPSEISVNPYATVDISPMDMSYYPVDYPKLRMAKSIIEPPLARVIYSRPHLSGRKLFQTLQKHGEYWRLGANEATELELYKNANINNTKINAGRYVLYAIPNPDKWTIVINSNAGTWGLEPDTTKDIARFDIPVKQTGNRLEYFTMIFEKNEGGADLVMAWDDLEARLPIKFD